MFGGLERTSKTLSFTSTWALSLIYISRGWDFTGILNNFCPGFHSLYKYVLSTYYVPDPVLTTSDSILRGLEKAVAPRKGLNSFRQSTVWRGLPLILFSDAALPSACPATLRTCTLCPLFLIIPYIWNSPEPSPCLEIHKRITFSSFLVQISQQRYLKG